MLSSGSCANPPKLSAAEVMRNPISKRLASPLESAPYYLHTCASIGLFKNACSNSDMKFEYFLRLATYANLCIFPHTK